MNVTSLELSKKPYELSGWSNTTQQWYVPGDEPVQARAEPNRQPANREWQYPAYDLGYLRWRILDELSRQHPDNGWEGAEHYRGLSAALLDGENETAKFAIELFKQGVLTRGGDES